MAAIKEVRVGALTLITYADALEIIPNEEVRAIVVGKAELAPLIAKLEAAAGEMGIVTPMGEMVKACKKIVAHASVADGDKGCPICRHWGKWDHGKYYHAESCLFYEVEQALAKAEAK